MSVSKRFVGCMILLACIELIVSNLWIVVYYVKWEKLTEAIKTLVKKIFLKTFYGEMIKQLIFLTAFYIFHESGFKIFLKWFINKCPKGKKLEGLHGG